MIPVSNQPVNFENDAFQNPYIEEVKYKQLVQQGDVTQFQFNLSNGVSTENVLVNPTFSENLDSWNQYNDPNLDLFYWEDGTCKYEVNTNPLDPISQPYPKVCRLIQHALIDGQEYNVQIKINKSFNGSLYVFLGTNKIAELTAGIHNVGGVAINSSNIGRFELRWVPTSDAFGGFVDTTSIVIDYVTVTPSQARNHIFNIVDVESGSTVDSVRVIPDPLVDPNSYSSEVELVDNSLTVMLDWQTKGIADGCYKINVIDAEVNKNLQCGCVNGEFLGMRGVRSQSFSGFESVTLPGWDVARSTSDVYVSPNVSQMQFTGNGTVTITQTGLKTGVTYNYQLNIPSISSSTINIKAGTATASFTTSGTKTGSLTCAGNGTLTIEFIGNLFSDNATLDYLRIEAITADLEVSYQSNPFNLLETHKRTLVLNCNNTEDVYGFNYERSLFNPTLRLRGYLASSENPYEIERITTETTDGTRQVVYNKRRKNRLLIIENEPEFIHDWLSLLPGHDHVMINNREFFMTEDDYPVISWDYYRVLGSTQIEISLKTELKRKVVTGEIGTPYFIADTDGDGISGGFIGQPLLSNGGDTQVDGTGFLIDPSAGGSASDPLDTYVQSLQGPQITYN